MVDKEAGKFLDFKEFCLEVKNLLSEMFDKECRIELNQVMKNNSIKLEGVVILQQNETIAPNIYLNNYYVAYQNGLSVKEIIQGITEEYNDARMQGDNSTITGSLEFTKVKSCIVYRLINYEKNKNLLNEIPHTRFLDLAVTFHCLVRSSDEGIGTIRITNQHLIKWNVTIDDLIYNAKINTPNLFPPVVQSMRKVIEKLMKEEINTHLESTFNIKDELENINLSYRDENYTYQYSHEDNMLVVSNQRNINGASCMIYTDLLKDIADQLNSDLYILPSSIHELIIVKNDNCYDKRILKEMVKDVNLTQVPLEDILSDNIYFYSRSRLAITQL
jgi:hypothetical protein